MATQPETTLKLRPAQEAILEYEGGRMAVSAVPGSGKTFTLSLLAAKLIAEPLIDVDAGQRVLVVTYLNASVDTFKARIRKQLNDRGLPDRGYDVRTLHSLALEIVRLANSGLGTGAFAAADVTVLDETQSNQFLAQAVGGWIDANRDWWQSLIAEGSNSPQRLARWRDVTERTASAFIRAAKNERYHANQILARLESLRQADGDEEQQRLGHSPLLNMLAGIYGRYQTILDRQGSLDFNDLIWQAADLLQNRPDLAIALRQQWPFVLEDEAQDSVPLQEALLEELTGSNGNWVRVGDPNQAITSTFTAAHPRFFTNFLEQADVVKRPLPNSGRNAPLIFNAANTMVDWVIDHHPEPEVRQHAFRRQHIEPTPPGDAQPNPPNSEARLQIRVYSHRQDEELPKVAQAAFKYAEAHPNHTLAILVPTNQLGFEIADHLDALNADYDNLLRGSSREREVAAALHAILSILANPLDTRALATAYESLRTLQNGSSNGEGAANSEAADRARHLQTVLRSVHLPETFLFPGETEEAFVRALPSGVVDEEDLAGLEAFAAFLRRLFELRTLPIDDLTLTLADELFAGSEVREADLAIAYQIASLLRQWRETQPEWRLPELTAQLYQAVAGQRSLGVIRPNDLGYDPVPGRITLSTQHSAKGLEWDAVYLVGVDGQWIPGSLESHFRGDYDAYGDDLRAEAVAQLHFLMTGEPGLYDGRSATETAHIEVICERLRLLYVGITRARRFLQISRSRSTRQSGTDRDTEPATVLGVLYRYLQTNQR